MPGLPIAGFPSAQAVGPAIASQGLGAKGLIKPFGSGDDGWLYDTEPMVHSRIRQRRDEPDPVGE